MFTFLIYYHTASLADRPQLTNHPFEQALTIHYLETPNCLSAFYCHEWSEFLMALTDKSIHSLDSHCFCLLSMTWKAISINVSAQFHYYTTKPKCFQQGNTNNKKTKIKFKRVKMWFGVSWIGSKKHIAQ